MRSKLMQVFGLLLLVFLVSGGDAFACAVCGTAIESSRKAFIYSTALLSIVPLAMIGGLVFYLFRVSRREQ
jgi:hypothetical protein